MKAMNPKRRLRFAREFPCLDQIPGFSQATSIKVERCDAGVLSQVGEVHDNFPSGDIRREFFAVKGGRVVALQCNRSFHYCTGQLVSESADGNNARQIWRRFMGESPDFIVLCDHRSSGPVVVFIYKADRFDWEEYFKRFGPQPKPEPEFDQLI